METYNISKELLNKVFIGLINSNSIKNSANKDSIAQILLKDLSTHSIEHIIHLILTDEYYEPLAIGDHFKMKPIKYDVSKEYEPDILCDMGLCDGDGNIFGYITGDSSWSSTDYNPFYNNLKAELYYHDANLQIKLVAKNVTPLELIKINKLDIPYFSKQIEETTPLKQEEETFNPF